MPVSIYYLSMKMLNAEQSPGVIRPLYPQIFSFNSILFSVSMQYLYQLYYKSKIDARMDYKHFAYTIVMIRHESTAYNKKY